MEKRCWCLLKWLKSVICHTKVSKYILMIQMINSAGIPCVCHCVCTLGSLPSLKTFFCRRLRWSQRMQFLFARHFQIYSIFLKKSLVYQHFLFFKVLDKEKKGYLESEEIKNYLTQEGGSKNVYSIYLWWHRMITTPKCFCFAIYYWNSTHCD